MNKTDLSILGRGYKLIPYINFQNRVLDPLTKNYAYPLEENGKPLTLAEVATRINCAEWEIINLKYDHISTYIRGDCERILIREPFLFTLSLPFGIVEQEKLEKVAKKLSNECFYWFMLLLSKTNQQTNIIKEEELKNLIFSKLDPETNRLLVFLKTRDELKQKHVLFEEKNENRISYYVYPVFKTSLLKEYPKEFRLRLLFDH